MDRTTIGIVEETRWPTFSVPMPVAEFFHKLARRLPPDVVARVIGKGYHNAGWAYLEVEIRALSYGHAMEEAKRVHDEVMCEFQFS